MCVTGGYPSSSNRPTLLERFVAGKSLPYGREYLQSNSTDFLLQFLVFQAGKKYRGEHVDHHHFVHLVNSLFGSAKNRHLT
jgi:hypothetical protein